MTGEYRFSFGPWNIHEGADPFGPPVRPTIEFGRKLKYYRELGFHAVQLHDDDAVPNIDDKSPQELVKQASDLKPPTGRPGISRRVYRPTVVGR